MTKELKRALPPVHPGEILREDILPALGVPKTEIAASLGISRNQLYNVLNETARITPDLAIRFGKLLGNGPMFWLRLQNVFDVWQLEPEIDADAIPTLEGAA